MQNVNTATTACRARAFSRRLRILILAAYLLIVSTLILPNSNAKFASSASGTSTAQIAKIDVNLHYEFSGYGDIGTVNGDKGDVYAIMEEFFVENNGDVAYEYDLSLVLSKDISTATYESPVEQASYTLGAPKEVSNVKYVYHPSEDSTTGAVVNSNATNLTGFGKFETGKAYYAASTDKSNYTWYSENLDADKHLNCAKVTLAPGEIYYYRILYFLAPSSTTSTFPQMTLFYNITCTQID